MRLGPKCKDQKCIFTIFFFSDLVFNFFFLMVYRFFGTFCCEIWVSARMGYI